MTQSPRNQLMELGARWLLRSLISTIASGSNITALTDSSIQPETVREALRIFGKWTLEEFLLPEELSSVPECLRSWSLNDLLASRVAALDPLKKKS